MAKTVEYVCHGARVKCDQGSVESKLKATDFTEIGNNLLITNRDTTFKSFTSTFGNCKRMNGQACVMQALPEWFDTNDDFATGMGISVVTTDSILICMTGGGAIRPQDSGQIIYSGDLLQGIKDGFLQYYPNQWEAYKEFFEYVKNDPVDFSLEMFKKVLARGNDPKQILYKDMIDQASAMRDKLLKALLDGDYYTEGYVIGELGAIAVELGIMAGVAKGISSTVKSVGGAVKGTKVPKTPKVPEAPKTMEPIAARTGADRARQYSSSWKKGSVKEAIDKFAPDSTPVYTDKGKIIYRNNTTGIEVVYDKHGDYFRINDTNHSGKRKALDLDGKKIPNNVLTDSGTQRGMTLSEYNAISHYKNTD